MSHQKLSRLPPTRTNAIGWKVNRFDENLFRLAMEGGGIEEVNAIKKIETVMRKVVAACDATMPRKRDTNQHPPMYW